MHGRLNGFLFADLDAALARAGTAIPALSGARLFITGGTGTIGQWLLALLARAMDIQELEIEILALSRDVPRFLTAHPDFHGRRGIRFLEGDIRNFPMPDGAFTHVIHGATETNMAAGDRPRELADSIIGGTRRVLDFAAASGARRFLHLSSGAIYGRQPAAMTGIDESFNGDIDPLDHRAVYGESKRAAEMMCAIAARSMELDAVIARIFAIVGPGLPLDAHFAIGNFIRDAMNASEIRISGDGSSLRSYIYSADLAVWLIVMLARGRAGAAYNVGSDIAYSIRELAENTRTALDSRATVRVLGDGERDTTRTLYIPSIRRAREELGLEIWTPLDVAIRRVADHENWRISAHDPSAASATS